MKFSSILLLVAAVSAVQIKQGTQAKTHVKKYSAKTIMEACDADKDDSLTLKEIKSCMSTKVSKSEQKELEKALKDEVEGIFAFDRL